MAQLVRAPRSHRGDRWFEPSCAQFIQYGTICMTKLHFILRKIERFPYSIITIIMLLALQASADLKSCLKFIHPVPWTQLKASPCTLSVRECHGVRSITFMAEYLPQNTSKSKIITIGTITRPPFKLMWDISKIPNQLTYGITCFAEAKLRYRREMTIKQGGIFLIHTPVEPPEYEISYFVYNRYNKNRKSITLSSPDLSSTAKVNISWNEKALMFYIKVNNSGFHSALPKEKLGTIGVKILLDPQNKRTAYFSKDILIFMIPVDRKPYRIYSASIYNSDGSFNVKETHDTCVYYNSVLAEDFKGYTAKFLIPQRAFVNGIPLSLGCNVIATVLDENSSVRELSWIKGNNHTISSPFAYGKLLLLEKPVLANPLILFALCFIIGLILGIIATSLYKSAQKFNTLVKFEGYEQEEQLIININTIIEAEITNKNFTIEDIASKLVISPRKVDKLVKRHFGRSFKKHLLYSRIEIVKERLRSSNASEISIANSCGFSSIDHMEKAFRSFNGTTPYKYREQNRIS